MAKVSIDINGRKYPMGCNDGEEERVLRLGQKLDNRVKSLANQVGQVGDLRLLVMAGIMLSDELDEVTGNISGEAEKMNAQMRKDSEAALAAAKSSEYEATDSLIKAAERIELLAARLADKNQG